MRPDINEIAWQIEDKLNNYIIDNNGCWIHQYSSGNSKYILIRYCSNGQYFKYYAHRVSFVIHKEDIPKGLFVCHSCDNPKCINPNHLFLGTSFDNMQDKVSKRRAGKQVNKETELDIRDLREAGFTYKKIGDMLNIHESTARKIYKRLKNG